MRVVKHYTDVVFGGFSRNSTIDIAMFCDGCVMYVDGQYVIVMSSDGEVMRFWHREVPGGYCSEYWDSFVLSQVDDVERVLLDRANVAHDAVFNAGYSLKNNEKVGPYATMRALRLRNVLLSLVS